VPRIFVTGPSLADEAMSLLSQRECVCGFGSDRDTSDDLARKVQAFRPDGLIVRKGMNRLSN
jgi:hypothetical protein